MAVFYSMMQTIVSTEYLFLATSLETKQIYSTLVVYKIEREEQKSFSTPKYQITWMENWFRLLNSNLQHDQSTSNRKCRMCVLDKDHFMSFLSVKIDTHRLMWWPGTVSRVFWCNIPWLKFNDLSQLNVTIEK